MTKNTLIGKKAMEVIKNSQRQKPKVVQYKINNKFYEAIVQPYLPYKQYKQLMNEIVALCYDTEGEYMPQNKLFAWKFCILFYYTDIDFSRSDASDIYDFINQTDIFENVSRHIKDDIKNILDFVEEKIKYINQKPKNSTNNISPLLEQYTTLAKELEGVDINKLINTTEKLANKNEKEIATAILDYQRNEDKESENTEKTS